MALLFTLGCVFADNTPPDIELLELLGQWQELSELGVDIDQVLEDAPEPDGDPRDNEQEAPKT